VNKLRDFFLQAFHMTTPQAFDFVAGGEERGENTEGIYIWFNEDLQSVNSMKKGLIRKQLGPVILAQVFDQVLRAIFFVVEIAGFDGFVDPGRDIGLEDGAVVFLLEAVKAAAGVVQGRQRILFEILFKMGFDGEAGGPADYGVVVGTDAPVVKNLLRDIIVTMRTNGPGQAQDISGEILSPVFLRPIPGAVSNC